MSNKKLPQIKQLNEPKVDLIKVENEFNETTEHAMNESNKQMVNDLLKACFESDQCSISKIEKQVEVIFKDLSGMLQIKTTTYTVYSNLDEIQLY